MVVAAGSIVVHEGSVGAAGRQGQAGVSSSR